MPIIDKCPQCGSEIEAGLTIWLNDVSIDTDDRGHWKGCEGTVKDFTPSGSADDGGTGIVLSEGTGCYVQCVEHGHSFSVNLPSEFLKRWSYGATPEPPEPPAELADAWERYQRGDELTGHELSKLDEWRADAAWEQTWG
jgi:hypothetical protein